MKMAAIHGSEWRIWRNVTPNPANFSGTLLKVSIRLPWEFSPPSFLFKNLTLFLSEKHTDTQFNNAPPLHQKYKDRGE
jgi:hypothetical protein